jgi:predicted tellurium resistance membrane protein TerC
MLSAESVISLLTLIVLEVILGIDNIIFIAILSDKLPESQRDKLRYWGISLAMIMRLVLLYLIAWIMKLELTLFRIGHIDISGKDLILIIGGLFLLYKSTVEIFNKTEKSPGSTLRTDAKESFKDLLIQILILDMVFSIDSIITAVGMVNELWVMYTAVIVTVVIMLFAARPISRFILKHPSFKILALCFLMMIGLSLIAEGLDYKIPKGYIYFAMAFSFMVDIIQMKMIKPHASENRE